MATHGREQRRTASISFEGRTVIVTGAGSAFDIATCGGAVVMTDLGGTVEGSNGSRTGGVVSVIKINLLKAVA